MKIHFTCFKCRESFYITEENISRKSKVLCPNCDAEFPDEALKNLKIATESIEKSHNAVKSKNELGETCIDWSFLIKE